MNLVNPTIMKNEPLITLPTARLIVSIMLPCVVIAGLWWLASGAGFWSLEAEPGLAAVAVVLVCTVGGLLVIQPWKPRPVSLWISIWMGQSVARLLATPVVAYLLYSATPLREGSATPFFLAVGVCFFAAILSEAGVVSRFLKRSTR